MTHSESDATAASEEVREDIAGALRLRPERPRIARLSRKILAGGGVFALAAVGGLAVWSLQNHQGRKSTPEQLYATEHNNVAEGVAGLPKDYAGIPREAPRLGPPLPGDLGRPMVAAQAQSGPLAGDAEQQRAHQEGEAARTSKLFASTTIQPRVTPVPSADTAASGTALSSDDAFAQNGQDRKLAFVTASTDRRTTSPDRLAQPASPFVVQAGTVIPAALITGIRSDLPGQIIAHVTESVFDSPTGRIRLIPPGARLIGSYDSQVAFGQSRVLLVWTRLIMPNGRSMVLERLPGVDSGGYAGLEDEVDRHWLELIKAAGLSTLLSVASELGASGNDDDIIRALRRGAGGSLNQTGQQLVQRNFNVQPTLTVRAGFPVKVIVNRDLVLEPWRE
jgi:type IV secretion system protein TrbI